MLINATDLSSMDLSHLDGRHMMIITHDIETNIDPVGLPLHVQVRLVTTIVVSRAEDGEAPSATFTVISNETNAEAVLGVLTAVVVTIDTVLEVRL